MNQRDGNVIRGNSLGLEDAFRRFFHEGRDSHGLCFNIAYPWGARPLHLVCGHLERPARGCPLLQCRPSECQTLSGTSPVRSGPLGHRRTSLLTFKVFGDSRLGCLTGFLADPGGHT